MPQIDPVILKLEADLADYKRGVTQAQRLTDQKLGDIQRSADRMGSGVSRAFSFAKASALAFVAANGIGAIKDLISRGLEYASSLQEQAAQLGVTSDALQEYYYLASQVGVTNEEMEQGLVMLNRRIGLAAAGNKEAANAFEQLGVEIKDATGHVRNAADLIPELAQGMSELGSDAERVAAATLLFGRSGAKLLPALQGGADEVNKLRQAAHDLGIVLSEEQIQRADETADKLSKMNQVISARIAGAVADNADSILSLVDALTKLVVAAGSAVGAWGRLTATLNQKLPSGFSASPLLLLGPLGMMAQPNFMSGLGRLGGGGSAPAAPSGPWYGRGQPTNGWYGRGNPGAARTFSLAGGGSGGGGGGGGGASGPSVDELARAMRESAIELDALAAEYEKALAELTDNVHDRAMAERSALEANLARDVDRVETDKELTDARKAELIAAHRNLAAVNRQLIEQEEQADLERESSDALEKDLNFRRDQERRRSDMADMEIDAVEAQARYADTLQQRNELERYLLGLQQEEARKRLEATIALESLADQEAARAALARQQEAEQRGLEQDQEGPGARYLRDLRDEADNLGQAYEQVAVDGLQRIEDALARTVKNAIGLHGALGDILGDLIQIGIRRAIIGPLADALFGAEGGGGGGGMGSLFSSIGRIFGRASGGYVGPGRMVRVNEGASPGRVEGFMPAGSGRVIPLGQMEAMRGGQAPQQAVVRLYVAEGQMFEPRVQAISGQVSVEVVKMAQPALTDAAANETMRRAGRPSL